MQNGKAGHLMNTPDYFVNEYKKTLAELPETPTQADLNAINWLGATAMVVSAADHLGILKHDMRRHANEIEEELASAAEKYAEYQKTNDQTMLNMSREELKHASYYINQAKMTGDANIRKHLSEYEKRYRELAAKINEKHGSEKLGHL